PPGFRKDVGRQAAPASFSTCRTVAGFIGAWRMRTPLASKNALAPAPPMPTVGGSPDPDRFQPALNAAMLPAFTSTSKFPGMTVVDLFGCTLASETSGASLKRRIGYVTQSRLVTRSLFQVGASYSAR